jgi:hypothetical protein
MYYDQKETLEAWQQPEVFRLSDVDKLKDGIVSEILVMVCNQCGVQVRYTFKEIEKEIRKKLSNRLLTMIAKGSIPDPATIRKADRIYIYCGKCNGYDGKGSCHKYIYDNCIIKRLPNGF